MRPGGPRRGEKTDQGIEREGLEEEEEEGTEQGVEGGPGGRESTGMGIG